MVSGGGVQCWKLILLLLAWVHYTYVSAKISDSGKYAGLGWPNFFNPKQAILRENEDKETNKFEEKYTVENFEDPETILGDGIFQENTEHDLEELIDYTIKGGLRGTYVLLNSSSNIDNLEEKEAQTAIRKILKVDENLFRKVDETLSKGETADRVRLRTPIILKTHSKALGKYGARISFFAGKEFTQMIHFGNWCGRGGRSAPVDNIDGCCLEHEKCYGKLVRQCPDVWKKPYRLMYAWLEMNNDPVCVRSDSTCVNHVCGCDREASLCLRYFVQNSKEIPLHVDASPLFSNRMEKKK